MSRGGSLLRFIAALIALGSLHFAAPVDAAGGAAAPAAQRIGVTIAAGHGPEFLWVKHLTTTFIPTVDRELARGGKYRIAWTEAFGGTLGKPGAELEAIEERKADLGIVSTLFHPQKMPLDTVTYAAPFGPRDPGLVCRVMDRLHATLPALRQSWERHNQVYLVGFCLDSYGIVATAPVTTLADFKGKRLGSPATLHPWIAGSGATPVTAALPEYHEGIKTSAYDGAITFASGAAPARLYEVAPIFSQTGFGAMYAGGVSVNKQSWDAFPAAVRAAFTAGAAAYARAYAEEQSALAARAIADIKAHRGRVVKMEKAERLRLARAIANPAKAWVVAGSAAGLPADEMLRAYMREVRQAGGSFVRDWDRE